MGQNILEGLAIPDGKVSKECLYAVRLAHTIASR